MRRLKGGEAAKHASGEEQPRVPRHETRPASEEADEQAHNERAKHVHGERSEWEAVAERTDGANIYTVT
jgi:hypothetical protein